MTEFVERARRFVVATFPMAEAAFLGGSAATGAATDSSDLDIVIILPDRWADAAFVKTTSTEGQLVEAFVYGPTALQRWLDKGRRERRPVVDRLIGEGIDLVGGPRAGRWAESSREVLAAGPRPLDAAESELRRYSLSAVLDDLLACHDAGERLVIAMTAWREAAELALLAERRWIGTGKWLLRELRSDTDKFGLVSWTTAADPETLVGPVSRVLEATGGYLQAGVIRGDRPKGL